MSRMMLQAAYRFLLREGWHTHTFADRDDTTGLAPWASAFCLPDTHPNLLPDEVERILVVVPTEVALYVRAVPVENHSWVRHNAHAVRIRWDDGKPGSRAKETRRAMRLLLKEL
jgi:hypothetical protein